MMQPSGETDQFLRERGFDLSGEYGQALDFAVLEPSARVLDVATGSGRMVQQLLERGHRVISGDITQEALDRARERLGDLAHEATLVILDARNMEFADDSFSSVTLANAIHEMDNAIEALREITRVTALDGKLLVVEFNQKGFELMELRHRMQGRGEHPKGEMSTEQIDLHLRSSFDRVETQEFGITHAWVASGKRRRRNR